jgi:hypothetical protein
MAYRPPQKRVQTTNTKPNKAAIKKDEFPELAPVPVAQEKPKMNFASIFKNVEKKKNKVKKLKWGTVLLTKNGRVDSLTQEEREYEETYKNEVVQDTNLDKICHRLIKQQNVRREYDPHYESPSELTVSSSEEEEEEEEEVLTDDYEEDEFEPEI